MSGPAAVELHVRRWGDGARRALLLHGIGSSSAGWWRLGPDLSDAGYWVEAVDLRGHGHSPKDVPLHLDDYAADLRGLGDGWDLVVAHSLGGAIVLASGLARPGWSEKLVLQDPAVLGSDDPEVIAWMLEEYQGEISPEAVAAANPTWHPTDAAFKAEAMMQSGPEAITETLVASGAWNLWDELMEVAIPTLLVGADPGMGALVQPAMGEAAAEGNPNIRFETIHGGSHSMHRDEYDAYWALVRDFVTG